MYYILNTKNFNINNLTINKKKYIFTIIYKLNGLNLNGIPLSINFNNYYHNKNFIYIYITDINLLKLLYEINNHISSKFKNYIPFIKNKIIKLKINKDFKKIILFNKKLDIIMKNIKLNFNRNLYYLNINIIN